MNITTITEESKNAARCHGFNLCEMYVNPDYCRFTFTPLERVDQVDQLIADLVGITGYGEAETKHDAGLIVVTLHAC